ncbi:putative MadN protein [Alteromonas macleodii str. 'Black Sea 11']|nr:putative MadN protein [Alteromonas macleodii str. 'Black Sea 11']NKW89422.1 DMT family transporter [Alteromonadaceae bacterium A_SAG4]NKX19700.1 DMT family transporter [Alteromonadaceae bacterium A_SAG8]NKX35677.1 DMT family transporter [Alteromonadaceae bacterium A_SAG3]NKX69625.1 DMT family transporter [Alteromonadaceae bacterium A_SAG7]
MLYLVAVTVLWAFSFSLIGEFLAGAVDSYFSVLTRIILASAVFLPFLKLSLLSTKQKAILASLGAVQLGLMYIFFYHAFLFLTVPEVLLFTIFTPLYVAILNDALFKRFTPFYLLCALIATAGAAVIRFNGVSENFWFGFAIVQGANLCFALGQVGYKKLTSTFETQMPYHNVFAWFYLGALAVALPAFFLFGNTNQLPQNPEQWGVLLWLGVVASGLGYYFWNQGALKVSGGTLAIMNNALIPAGLVVNLLLWQKDTDFSRLFLGGAIIALALWMSHQHTKKQERP